MLSHPIIFLYIISFCALNISLFRINAIVFMSKLCHYVEICHNLEFITCCFEWTQYTGIFPHYLNVISPYVDLLTHVFFFFNYLSIFDKLSHFDFILLYEINNMLFRLHSALWVIFCTFLTLSPFHIISLFASNIAFF